METIEDTLFGGIEPEISSDPRDRRRPVTAAIAWSNVVRLEDRHNNAEHPLIGESESHGLCLH